jgi:hypothetical protein
LFAQFKMAEAACRSYIDAGWTTVGNAKHHLMALPAYDQCIKASHVFNLLDARGVISVTERQSYILRVRELAKACGEAWLATEGSTVSAPKLNAAPKEEAHSAEEIRNIAIQAMDDALRIMTLVELLRQQNTGGINSRLSMAGARSATFAIQNAMISDLILLISRSYDDPKPGDLHLQAAAELLKRDKTAREIFDSSATSKKVADFEAHWLKCRGDHRRQRIKHFRDKYTAHHGRPKDIPNPEYAELFEFAQATVQAVELLALATGVAVKPLKGNSDSLQSAEAFWKPWTED